MAALLAAPSVSSISPSSVLLNQATTLTVNGSNFQSGFSAAITTPSGTFPIASAGLTFVSSSQVRVQVTMGGTSNYTASLKITNPDGLNASGSFQVVTSLPAPSVSSISPSTVTLNQATTLTVNGSNFQSGFSASVISPSGTFPIASTGLTFISSSQVRVQVTMGGTSAYTASLRITNPDGQNATGTFQVAAPAPSISSVSPSQVTANQTTTLTASGSNLQSGFSATVITPEGSFPIASTGLTFISSSQVRVQVTMGGTSNYTATLRITNPDGQNATGTFQVVAPSLPAPSISNINPSTVTISQATLLTVNGSNFQNGFGATVITPGGTFPIASTGLTFVNSGQVKVQVTMGGTPPYSATLKITNPDGQSGTGGFQVASSSPTINSISPNPVILGQATTLTVNGSNFQSGFSATVITPGGTFPIASTGLSFINSSQVQVQVTMGGSPPYTATLRITNPDGQLANGSFQVVAPAPSVTSISPSPVTINQPTLLTVSGSNFQNGFSASVITPEGTFPIATTGLTFISGSQVKVQVTMGGNSPYTATLRITNADGQNGSGTFQVVVPAIPAPSISSISPNQVPVGQVTTLTVNGSNFQSGFGAMVTGPAGTFPIASTGLTFINSGQVQVQVTMGSTPPYAATLKISNTDGQNATGTFQVVAAALPAPAISSIVPSTVTIGQPTTLTVIGSGFQNNFTATVITPGGTFPIASTGLTFVNGGQVRIQVTMGGTPPYSATLKITNPDGQSATSTFQVVAAASSAPAISAISPDPVILGQATNLTVSGSNFQNGFSATVTTAGGTFSIASAGLTYVSSSQVRVQVTMGGTPPYTATLKIINPDQQSATGTFQVTSLPPAPSISGITPSAVIVNQSTTLTVNGSNFQSGFAAQVTGPAGTFDIATAGLTFVSSNQVKVQVSMGSTPPYNATLRIINPDQQIATRTFQVVAATPAPVISNIDPSNVVVNQATTLTVNGSNFQDGFTAKITGPAGTFDIVSAARTFVNSNQVKVQVTMGSTPPYAATLRITNPDQQTTTRSFQVASATQPPTISPLQVIGIEVTQGIQDLKNSVVLIQDKLTFVRVHVKSTSGNAGSVTGLLTGRRKGSSNPLGTIEPANGKITILQNPSRTSLNDSFYFILPQEWARGDVGFEFQGISQSFQCKEPDGSPDCNAEVSFKTSARMQINIVSIVWRDLLGRNHKPIEDEIQQTINEIKMLFPVPDLDISRSEYVLDKRGQPRSFDELNNINRELLSKRVLDGCSNSQNCKRYYLGLISGLDDLPASLGLALASPVEECPNVNLRGDVATAYVTPQDNPARFTPAHELGHDLGRRHTNYAGTEGGPCPASPLDGTIGGRGRNQYSADTVYGFFGNSVYHADTPDLMSYGSYSWISANTYSRIYDRLKSRYGILSAGSTSSSTNADRNLVTLVNAGENAVMISGTVSPTSGTGEIASIYTVNAPDSALVPDPGAYTIRFESSQGQLLASYSFDPAVSSEGTTGAFALLLPWNTNTSRVVLLYNNQEIYSRRVSAHMPAVAITSPNGGETLTGSTATIHWSANDLDGDALTYIVQYSADAGATWQTLATDWSTTTYELNLNSIAGTERGLIRVLASDGVYTAQDQSDASFSVARQAPQVTIRIPGNNALYYGDQVIVLEGSAYSDTDGELSNAAMNWSSNLNGSLGSGRALTVSASSLAEGSHIISLTARGSDGQSRSANITIQVSRARPTLSASLSVSPPVTNLSIGVGSVQPSPKVVAIRNNGDGNLNWSASADQSWIRLDSTSGVAPTNISLSADPTGLPIGQYIGHVVITPSNAPNSPQSVTVTLNVVAAFVSGRVIDSTGIGVGGVTLTLGGTQTGIVQTDSEGYYLFGSLPAGGNITITPSKTNYTFNPPNQSLNNLGGNQVVNFTTRINTGVPVLVSEQDSTRALALDAVLRLREPFQFSYPHSWSADRRTRIMFFATNFELSPNESASAVTADAEDAAHRIYPLVVEYVGKVPGFDWLTCVIVKVNDDIGDVGDVLVRITYHGVSSNRVRVGIGHIGGGIPDDAGAIPTPGRPPQ